MTIPEIPGITLHYWTREWNGKWNGSFIQHFRGVGENKFILRTRTRDHMHEWTIHFPSAMIETHRKWEAMKEQPGVVSQTKSLIENQKVVSITQHGMDRIVLIECMDVYIVIELFGDGNWVVLDKEKKIKSILHAREWKTRTLKRGETYQFPPGPPEWESLNEKPIHEENKTLGGWMATQLGIPPVWTQEVCQTIERKPTDIEPLSKKEWEKLRKVLKKTAEKEVTHYLLMESREKEWVLPECGIESEGKIVFRGTLSEMDEQVEERAMRAEEKKPAEDKLEKERRALTINLERQKKMAEGWGEKIKELQKSGEWIYEHYETVEKLIQAVRNAREKKKSDSEVTQKVNAQLKAVKRVNVEKGTIELEIE